MTLADYLPIALMAMLGLGFAGVSFFLSYRLTVSNPTPAKLAPYESGIVPLRDPVQRFPVKFYMVAMLFVLFDIEIVFLFAWAVRFEALGWPGVVAIGIFTLLLIETLGYVWKRGALDWNEARRERYRRVVAPEPPPGSPVAPEPPPGSPVAPEPPPDEPVAPEPPSTEEAAA